MPKEVSSAVEQAERLQRVASGLLEKGGARNGGRQGKEPPGLSNWNFESDQAPAYRARGGSAQPYLYVFVYLWRSAARVAETESRSVR